jgi:hypothetical protein
VDNTFDMAGFIATEFANADEYARPVQRHRHELYVRALSDTDDMSTRHQLGTLWSATPTPHYASYLDASAYQSASRTLDPIKSANVGLFMSQNVMWLSAVDLLLDDVVLPRLLHSGWDPDQQEKYLDTVLWAIAAGLLDDIPEDRVGALLGARYARDSADITADESNIRRIISYLGEHLAVLPFGTADSGRRLVAGEIAAALGAQRNELMFALRFAHDGSLPSLTDYLNLAWGYPRILIAPMFALTPEVTEAGEFSDWLPAAIACGRVTRIANDSGTFFREQIERQTQFRCHYADFPGPPGQCALHSPERAVSAGDADATRTTRP